MNNDAFFPIVLHLPTNWSPEDALQIIDFLSEISSSIWRVYEADINRHLDHKYALRPCGSAIVNHGEDDLPF